MRKRILRFKRLHALAEQKEARARMNMLLAKKELQKEQTLLQQVQGYVQDYQSILKPNQELSTIRFAELGLFLNQLNTMLLAAQDRLSNAKLDLKTKESIWQQKKMEEKSLDKYYAYLQDEHVKYLTRLEQYQTDERNSHDFVRKWQKD
jgi:flagellar export protein FliJ